MTLLQKINCFAIGLPFAIAALAVFEVGMLSFALLSTVITGFLQVSIALVLFINHYKNRHLQAYLLLCILFFSLWFTMDWGWIWAMPPSLALYMTVILHYIVTEKPQ
ncbi:hypothetical protein [uncultured Flavobacterium sp.]|uniref:hypothetical protein n=1 Tax=uncultured Flavobacterium sp. TaxID=165435 RepID=UPI0011FE70BD|nr:hypothetical protein [uncultured Flavobacterium sp.]THD31387.1 MAG: hypothetical protein DI588_11550 [Flavobacterium johnsoniae]